MRSGQHCRLRMIAAWQAGKPLPIANLASAVREGGVSPNDIQLPGATNFTPARQCHLCAKAVWSAPIVKYVGLSSDPFGQAQDLTEARRPLPEPVQRKQKASGYSGPHSVVERAVSFTVLAERCTVAIRIARPCGARPFVTARQPPVSETSAIARGLSDLCRGTSALGRQREHRASERAPTNHGSAL